MNAMSGMRTRDETTEPATRMPEERYPRMKPTARSAGPSSTATSAFGRNGSAAPISGGTRKSSPTMIFMAAPTAMPRKIQTLPLESAAVARRTSAQAVPSGYGRSRSSMRSRRSGIIAERPRSAPRKQSATTCRYGGAVPQRKSAGIVKIEPVASEVDAEPIVCERFASRIEPFAPKSRKSATVMTAAGIEAETVRPTRRPRYAFAAPKTRPRTTPAATALAVNSGTDSPRAETPGGADADTVWGL